MKNILLKLFSQVYGKNQHARQDALKDELINDFSSGTEYTLQFLKWLALASLSGTVCGLLGTFFYSSIEEVTSFRLTHPYITLFLPISGLIIVFIYKKLGVYNDKGTNLVLDSIHSHEQIPDVMAPLIYAGTVLTHLFGGSSGREGAALQMGGCIGVFLGKKLKMDEKDINVLTMCGMSAVFTAMFGTPITATVFSMEVISVGMFHYSAFVPCIIASTISLGISGFFGIGRETFTILRIPELSIVNNCRIIVLSITCGLIAIIFCKCIHSAHKIYSRIFSNNYIKIFIGGTIVSAFTFIEGSQYYSGSGFNIVRDAFNGHTGIEIFIVKLLLTALTAWANIQAQALRRRI